MQNNKRRIPNRYYYIFIVIFISSLILSIISLGIAIHANNVKNELNNKVITLEGKLYTYNDLYKEIQSFMELQTQFNNKVIERLDR